MNVTTMVLCLAALVLGGVAGYLIASLRRSREISLISGDLQKRIGEANFREREHSRTLSDLAGIRQRLESEQQARVAAETERAELTRQLGDRDGLKKEMEGTYAKLTEENLRASIDHLVKMVEPRLEGNKAKIESTLDSKKVEIEGLMKPLREMLEKYHEELRFSEEKRNTAYGTIEQGIRDLREQTTRVSTALSGTKTRGNWGELALKRCVEIAGLTEHCDFDVQKSIGLSIEGSDGGRPDMIVRLPNDRMIIVDAKAPLDAYQQAMEEGDEKRQGDLLKQHARNLRRCVDDLSRRKYSSGSPLSLEFTVLFIPGDHFLSAALAAEPDLYQASIDKKIFLASPTLLMALLQVVAAGWKADSAEENATASLKIGKELYDRFLTVFEHIEKVGRSLRNAVGDYNKAISSIDRRLAPKAGELQKKVGSSDDLPPMPQIEETILRSAKLSLTTQSLFDPEPSATEFEEEVEEEEDAIVR